MTKESSSRKHNSHRKTSKFSMLRRKLTLKKRNSPVPYNEAKEAKEELSPEIVVHAKANKPFQRASPMKLVRLYPEMTPEQTKLICDADYPGLVSIRCSKLQPQLCKFLMKSFNPVTCELVFPGRGKIPINEQSIQKVIGVPRGDLDVRYDLDQDAINFMNQKLGNRSKTQPTIASLEKKLAGMKKADTNYLRLFITYGLASVLAPNSSTLVSPRLYPSMVNIKVARRLNMCKFVLAMLMKAARSKTEKGMLQSCQLYFMVKYLDPLELDGIDVSDEGIWVSVWTNAMVRKAIQQDQRSDGSFGMASLKPEFRDNIAHPNAHEEEYQDVETNANYEEVHHLPSPNNVNSENEDEEQANGNDPEVHQDEGQQDFNQGTILFSDPEVINRFMHMNVPQDSSPQDLVTYREAISEACYGFETSLQLLIRKLSHRPKEKKRKRRNKKGSASKRKKKEKNEEIPRVSDEDKDYGESDKDTDYVCEDEDADCTQTTVSLVDEEFDLDGSWQHREEVDTGIFSSHKIMDESGPLCWPKQEHTNQTSVLPVDDTHSDAKLAPSMVTTVPTGTCTTSDEHQQEVTFEKNTTVDPKHTAHNDGQDEMCLKSRKEGPHQYPLNVVSETEAGIDNANVTSREEKSSSGMQLGNNNVESTTTTTQRHIQSAKQNDADQNNVNCPTATGFRGSRMMFEDLLAFVRTKVHTKVETQSHLVLEPPVIFDWETLKPTSGALQDIVTTMLSTNTDSSKHDFQDLPTIPLSKEAEKLLSEMEPTYVPSPSMPPRKTVTFADEKEKNANNQPQVLHSPSRCRTRSAVRKVATSNVTISSTSGTSLQITPSRLTRTAARLNSDVKKDVTARSPESSEPVQQLAMDSSVPKTTTPTVPSSAAHNSMNRKLNFDSSSSERIRELLMRAPDAPPFDLGFESEDGEHTDLHLNRSSPITSSAVKEFMDLTLDSEEVGTEDVGHIPTDVNNVPEAQAVTATTCSDIPSGSNQHCKEEPSAKSIIHVPHEYQKRVVKESKFQRSPYIDYDTKRTFIVSKPVNELYNMVCMHTTKSRTSQTKMKPVIDFGTFFIILRDLADSVAPGHKLVNSVCEIAIHVLRGENKNTKKFIMPLRMSTYLIDCRFSLKEVKNCFTISATNRLDHQELICFPTLQCWDGSPESSPGHYFLVTLNLKAQRFEIMDSITTKNGEPIMLDACHFLIASIKKMWLKEYKAASVDISNWPIEIIPSPVQKNGYDCGFFMLKNLEEWHGRKLPYYDQTDLPNIRKLYNDKLIRYHENKVAWQLVV